MLDNVTIDRLGRILMDEDPGNRARISKVWFFDGSTPNNPSFLTQDEESSGIIDAAGVLGEGWFLLDVQVHKANPDVELVEGGQLLALFVDPGVGFTSCRSDRDDEDDDDRRHHR